MDLSIFKKKGKKKDQILSIDLGTHLTKGVLAKVKGDNLELINYAIVESEGVSHASEPAQLGKLIKKVVDTLGGSAKTISLALGGPECVLRPAEVSLVPKKDMILMMKHNSKNYLQQDFPNYAFDCYVIPCVLEASKEDDDSENEGRDQEGTVESKPGSGKTKAKVLVGGIPKQTINNVQEAVKAAGLAVDFITPNLVSPINTLERVQHELFKEEPIAVVDIGYASSNINILSNGQLILNRVVGFGGKTLTKGLSNALSIDSAEAEGLKVGMPQEVEQQLRPLLASLCQELRVSINYFEVQQDVTVSQIFLSGGTARSKVIVDALQEELVVPCQSLNTIEIMEINLEPEAAGELADASPQLAVAVGTILAQL